MARTTSIAGRLARLEQAVPRRCPACAGRPRIDGMLFRYEGVLQTAHGAPVDESVLSPCPLCSGGGVEKILDGVNPGAMLGHNIHVIVNVDPKSI